MGLPERKNEEKKEQEVVEETSKLLDENEMFTGKPLPFKEVEYVAPDGTVSMVMIQALTLTAIDEVNHIQGQPVKDARGNIIEEANDIGWDAKIVARALRKPNRMPVAPTSWLALAEKISTQWLPGTTKNLRTEVLKLSGYLPLARQIQKKDS